MQACEAMIVFYLQDLQHMKSLGVKLFLSLVRKYAKNVYMTPQKNNCQLVLLMLGCNFLPTLLFLITTASIIFKKQNILSFI